LIDRPADELLGYIELSPSRPFAGKSTAEAVYPGCRTHALGGDAD
jgi:hypothetical protein